MNGLISPRITLVLEDFNNSPYPVKKHLLLLFGFLLVFAACEPVDEPETPDISTVTITNITQTTAKGGGEVISEGDTPVTERGICWSTNSSPTTADTKASSGTGGGIFEANITDLQPNTKYFVRAYATNAAGTSYGSEVEFTTTLPLKGLTVSTTKSTVAKGLTISFKAEGSYADNTTKDLTDVVTWSSANDDIITNNGITENGTFLAAGVGEAYVKASIQDFIFEYQVTVMPAALVSIELQADKDRLAPGESEEISVIGTYSDGSTGKVGLDLIMWTSSDTDILGSDWNVSQYFLVAKNFGEATMTAQVGDLTATFDVTVALSLGLEYGGGIIFYLDETGQHGLVAAPSDQSDGAKFWLGTWIYVDGVSNTPDQSVGAGQSNTETQVTLQGNGTYAAKICSDLVLNDHDDWFLPSSGELQLICQNLYQQGLGNFNDLFYWSSTDADRKRNANFIQFSDNCGIRNDLGRDMLNRVRAVRKF
jgi:hypothetical protein